MHELIQFGGISYLLNDKRERDVIQERVAAPFIARDSETTQPTNSSDRFVPSDEIIAVSAW